MRLLRVAVSALAVVLTAATLAAVMYCLYLAVTPWVAGLGSDVSPVDMWLLTAGALLYATACMAGAVAIGVVLAWLHDAWRTQ